MALLEGDKDTSVKELGHVCSVVRKAKKDVFDFRNSSTNHSMTKDIVDRFERAMKDLSETISDKKQTASVVSAISERFLSKKGQSE